MSRKLFSEIEKPWKQTSGKFLSNVQYNNVLETSLIFLKKKKSKKNLYFKDSIRSNFMQIYH